MIFAIFLLIAASAFFAGVETALTAASQPLMRQLEQEGDERAATVTRILTRRSRMITSLLLGNVLVHVLASALTTQLMIQAFGDHGVVYATVVMTILVVIYGEILPKTYAILYPTTVSLHTARITSALLWVLHPFNIAIEVFVNAALKLLGVADVQKGSAERILAELRGAIEFHMTEPGVKEEVKHERAMLRSVLDLANVTVGEIMIHRKKVVTIDAALPVPDIIEQIAGSAYSRVPLWRDRSENIVGVLHAKALLRALDATGGQMDKIDVVGIAAKPWFVPDTTTLQDQLHAFRARREHFALVVDEYGTLQGALTLEDILEEIVGDIRDEHDIAVAGVRPQTDGSYLIDGSVTLRDLNREFDWALPDDQASTLAGYLLHEARTIPDTGQKFLFAGFRFDVVRRARNQLTLIRVTPPKTGAQQTAA